MLLLACGAPSDAVILTRALEAGDPAICVDMRDAYGRAECVAAVVPEDPADCHELPALWRDECVFSSAEALASTDLPAAIDACHDSRFARECSFHLIRDQARSVAADDAAAASTVAATLSDIPRAPDARFLFWQEWFVAGRAEGIVASPDRCEGASDPLDCVDGLRRLGFQTVRGLGLERACERMAAGPLAQDLDVGPEIRGELMDPCPTGD